MNLYLYSLNLKTIENFMIIKMKTQKQFHGLAGSAKSPGMHKKGQTQPLRKRKFKVVKAAGFPLGRVPPNSHLPAARFCYFYGE